MVIQMAEMTAGYLATLWVDTMDDRTDTLMAASKATYSVVSEVASTVHGSGMTKDVQLGIASGPTMETHLVSSLAACSASVTPIRRLTRRLARRATRWRP